MAKGTFGEFFKKLRIAHGHTLRRFCEEHSFDPGNISKLERGLLPPPEPDGKLAEYANALGLVKGSSDWYEFFDLARVSRGEIPRDLLSDEQVIGKLPLLFRTLRGEKVTEKKLNALIDLVRKA